MWARPPTTNITLGPINDDGLLENSEELYKSLSNGVWFGINEAIFRRILDGSLTHNFHDPSRHLEPSKEAQIITGLSVPQPESSEISRDVRLAGLRIAQCDGHDSRRHTEETPARTENCKRISSASDPKNPDYAVLLSSAVGVLQAQFTKMLRLGELIDPAYPLNTYGMDSLAAAEPRSWVRTTFGVQLTTLDVVNAPSLVALCQKIISKMGFNKKGEEKGGRGGKTSSRRPIAGNPLVRHR